MEVSLCVQTWRGGSRRHGDSDRLKSKGFESQRCRHRIMMITEPLGDELLTGDNNASFPPLPPEDSKHVLPAKESRTSDPSAVSPVRF